MATHTNTIKAALRTLTAHSVASLLGIHVSHVYNAAAGRGVSEPLRAALVSAGLVPGRKCAPTSTVAFHLPPAETARLRAALEMLGSTRQEQAEAICKLVEGNT